MENCKSQKDSVDVVFEDLHLQNQEMDGQVVYPNRYHLGKHLHRNN